MNKHLKICVASALLAGVQVFSTTATLAAGTNGTPAEAQDMVKRAVALIKSAGPESAYKTFTQHPDGAFKDRDLYVFVYDFQGNCLAQGANPKMVGKNFIDLRDMDGNQLIKGQIDMVRAHNAGWYGPYKFTNPVTKALQTKKAYCERGVGDTDVCVGVYID